VAQSKISKEKTPRKVKKTKKKNEDADQRPLEKKGKPELPEKRKNHASLGRFPTCACLHP